MLRGITIRILLHDLTVSVRSQTRELRIIITTIISMLHRSVRSRQQSIRRSTNSSTMGIHVGHTTKRSHNTLNILRQPNFANIFRSSMLNTSLVRGNVHIGTIATHDLSRHNGTRVRGRRLTVIPTMAHRFRRHLHTVNRRTQTNQIIKVGRRCHVSLHHHHLRINVSVTK